MIQSRYAINCVIQKDFSTPLIICKFLNELNSGLQLFNFKNDSLRKRFDAVKYDVKRVEQVVYDISVRKLSDEKRMD